MKTKRVVSAVMIVATAVYAGVLAIMLFLLPSRDMVVVDPGMLAGWDWRRAVILVPFQTIGGFIADLGNAVNPGARANAARNLIGNLLLLVPLGLVLPYFLRAMRRFLPYLLTVAVLIVAIEVTQVVTMSGTADIDDFLLNLAGAVAGYFLVTRTPIRRLLELRAW
jgi:glycopeptide antibiotics resistance protein